MEGGAVRMAGIAVEIRIDRSDEAPDVSVPITKEFTIVVAVVMT